MAKKQKKEPTEAAEADDAAPAAEETAADVTEKKGKKKDAAKKPVAAGSTAGAKRVRSPHCQRHYISPLCMHFHVRFLISRAGQKCCGGPENGMKFSTGLAGPVGRVPRENSAALGLFRQPRRPLPRARVLHGRRNRGRGERERRLAKPPQPCPAQQRTRTRSRASAIHFHLTSTSAAHPPPQRFRQKAGERAQAKLAAKENSKKAKRLKACEAALRPGLRWAALEGQDAQAAAAVLQMWRALRCFRGDLGVC